MNDVVSYTRCGRGSQTNNWNIGKFCLEERELLERRTEVMTPFTDTMGFVDGDTGQFALGVDDS
jgi:hypothetical protein